MNWTRREVREKALQALFQLSSNAELTQEEAIRSALLSEVEEEEEPSVPEYLAQLVSGVVEHQETIDETIESHLKNWSLKRLAKTDLLVLRIGTYELLYETDIPDNVVMNEAIEITKRFSDEKSSKFVNGVLANISKETEK